MSIELIATLAAEPSASATETSPQPTVLITPDTAELPGHSYRAIESLDASVESLLKQPPEKTATELPSREKLVATNKIRETEPLSRTAVNDVSEPPIDKAAENLPRSETTIRPQTSSPSVVALSNPASEASLKTETPQFRFNPPPTYPDEARHRGWQGTVVLRITVSATGQVTNVDVKQSSGFSVLDAAAAQAVRTWRGEPARRAGRAVESHWDQPIRFRL